MDPTIIGVVIGGVIGSASAGFVAWLNHRTEVSKMELEHKNSIKRMEYEKRSKIIADAVEAIDACYQEHCIFIHYCRLFVQQNGKLPDEIFQEMFQCRSTLLDRLRGFSKAEAQLLLLGENECSIKMDVFQKSASQMVGKYHTKAKVEDFAGMDADMKVLVEARASVYAEMQRAAGRLPS